MLVHVGRIRAEPGVDSPAAEFEKLAAIDRFRQHNLSDQPDVADVILFTQCHMVDWRLRAIREHSLATTYSDKVMVYDERDRPWRSFPGVYVSAPLRDFDHASQRAWAYAGTPAMRRAAVAPDLLFSFVGSPTARCRRPLFDLRHPDAVVEQVQGFTFWSADSSGFRQRQARFRQILARSRFVLCPRGNGTSSFRLYETLAAGRVPVIISDDWVAPSGPDWHAFSLRWPERKVDDLVEWLEQRNVDWPQLSTAACQAYDTFFAPDVTFHRIIELCRELREAGSESAPLWRLRARSLVEAARERVQVR